MSEKDTIIQLQARIIGMQDELLESYKGTQHVVKSTITRPIIGKVPNRFCKPHNYCDEQYLLNVLKACAGCFDFYGMDSAAFMDRVKNEFYHALQKQIPVYVLTGAALKALGGQGNEHAYRRGKKRLINTYEAYIARGVLYNPIVLEQVKQKLQTK